MILNVTICKEIPVKQKNFFSRLSYSIGNEDWRTEERALDLQPNDHVLCITASGDRPLNLLVRNCRRMVCIDANQTQNRLLALKIAALKTLTYKDYLSFLGITPETERRTEVLEKLLPQMDPETGAFWKKNKNKIQKGIIYQGEVERLTKISAAVIALIQGKKIKRLFEINDLEEQKKFIDEEWNGFIWRKIFQVVLNPLLSRFIIQDPGLTNVGKTIKPGSYIYERINSSLTVNLAKKNLLLSLVLKGEISSEAYSPYLTKQGIQAIKNHLSAIEIRTEDIVEYIESIRKPTFDAFSLSDVASYLSSTDFIRLLKGMVIAAKPGARFCMRQFLSTHEIPEELQEFFKRDPILEKELEKQDNCFVYRFMVGTIHPVPEIKTADSKKINQIEVAHDKRLVGV